MELPTHTTCGHCNRTVKLKRSQWEPWEDGHGCVVGIVQTRRCPCRSTIVAAVGDEEFMRLMVRHWNANGGPRAG